ncbi:MAG: DUF6249 domain-containing protein [bacterium]|nr:DUF6249 domain-containing protein [bacterium]
MEQHWVSFLIPIVAILMGGLIAIIVMVSGSLEKRKYYETVTKAIEAGKTVQEIKELLGNGPESRKEHPKHRVEYGKNLKKGIITLGVGAGLILFGFIQTSKMLTGAGAFIGVIGLSFILVHYFLPRAE